MTHSQSSTNGSFAEEDGLPEQDSIRAGAVLLCTRLGAQLVPVLAAKVFQCTLLQEN